MADPLTAFPARALHPRPPGLLQPFVRPVLVAHAVVGMILGTLAGLGPAIVADWGVRGAAVPIRGGHLVNGSCRDEQLVNWCDVTLVAPLGVSGGASGGGSVGGTVTHRVSYLFGTFGTGRMQARVVGDPARPDWLATDLGLERFWNRVMCLLTVCAVLAGGVAGCVRSIVRAARTRRAWHRAEMVAVPLTLLGRKGAAWTLRTEGGREVRWTMSHFARPFVLGPADRVAGLSTRNGGSVMPLDSRLSWVVLTGAERRAIRAAQKAGARA